MMYELDYYDEMNTARDMGLAEGEAKGRAKERAEVAKNLIAMNMPAEDIASVTGLSLAEIAAL